MAVPLTGAGAIDGQALATGTCWSIEGEAQLTGDGVDLLIAMPL